MLGPAKAPCSSCPYRRDVPSGVWDESEYARLATFDSPRTSERVFVCHKTPDRLCAGWCGTHDMENLLGLRIAASFGTLTPEEYRNAVEYVSPVPLFTSGAEAAAHGLRDLESPSEDARQVIERVRKYAQRNMALEARKKAAQ